MDRNVYRYAIRLNGKDVTVVKFVKRINVTKLADFSDRCRKKHERAKVEPLRLPGESKGELREQLLDG